MAAIIGVTTSYNRAAATACNAQVSAAACDDEPHLDPSCLNMFTGTRGTDAPCFTDFQCTPDRYCGNINQTTRCGTCQPRVPAAGDCSGGKQCVAGHQCVAVNNGSGSPCTAFSTVYVGAGQSCGANNTAPRCRGIATCDAASGNTCKTATVLSPGSRCDPDDVLQQCPVHQNCVTSLLLFSFCEDRPRVGERCNGTWGPLWCTGNSYCDIFEQPSTVTTGQCFSKRAAGGDCSNLNLYGEANNPSDDLAFVVCGSSLECLDSNHDGQPAGNTCGDPVPSPEPPMDCR